MGPCSSHVPPIQGVVAGWLCTVHLWLLYLLCLWWLSEVLLVLLLLLLREVLQLMLQAGAFLLELCALGLESCSLAMGLSQGSPE
jgi:hypothetical protein